MTYMLNSIDDAIDRKFLVTKNMKGQTAIGSIIHVMGATQTANSVVVDYRVTTFDKKFSEYKNFSATFDNLKQFCSWARPDVFIARHYENLSLKDIRRYIKMKNRTFFSYCLPIILVLAAVIWALAILALDGVATVIVGTALTIVAAIFVVSAFKKNKKQEMQRLYKKIGTGWNVVFK